MKINKSISALLVTAAFAVICNQAFSEPDAPAATADAPAPVVKTTTEITGVDAAVIKIMQRPPLDAVKDTPVGKLKNPFNAEMKELVELGRKRYLGASCNGCHGGSGGGGMCPPLSNEVWVYGSDDDTLFRLVSLGSVELTAQTGLTRKGRENVVGPMPPHGEIVKTEEDLWKIVTYIRANYRGDPSKKTW